MPENVLHHWPWMYICVSDWVKDNCFWFLFTQIKCIHETERERIHSCTPLISGEKMCLLYLLESWSKICVMGIFICRYLVENSLKSVTLKCCLHLHLHITFQWHSKLFTGENYCKNWVSLFIHSPPMWMQKVYYLPHSKYSLCYSVSGGEWGIPSCPGWGRGLSHAVPGWRYPFLSWPRGCPILSWLGVPLESTWDQRPGKEPWTRVCPPLMVDKVTTLPCGILQMAFWSKRKLIHCSTLLALANIYHINLI